MTTLDILVLYNGTQTYTNTVFDHVSSFGRFSKSKVSYVSLEAGAYVAVDFARFDVVIIHYSIRVCFDQISKSMAKRLNEFDGLKVLFIQDEYDNTHHAWHCIRQLGISLVFTVVPTESIMRVYPPDYFPGVRFVSNITGYAPDGMKDVSAVVPPSQRKTLIGYRARNLPIRYGALGFEKVEIGRLVKAYCDSEGLLTDIAWTEDARVYGDAWTDFLQKCRANLGSESGSNVFNWEGTLDHQIKQWRKANPAASDAEAYAAVVAPNEVPGLMNQVSPRVFESIANRNVLVLFEGRYSDVVESGRHYLPLKKDGSNLPEIIAKLQDDAFVDEITERTYHDVLASGRFSYRAFVEMVDMEIAISFAALPERRAGLVRLADDGLRGGPVTEVPIRATATFQSSPGRRGAIAVAGKRLVFYCVFAVWRAMPESVKAVVRRVVRGSAQ